MSAWPLWTQIQSHAARAPHHPAYVEMATDRTLTYGQLAERVQHHATDLPELVTLQSANAVDFPVRFLAALLSGRDVLPASVDVPAEELRLTESTIREAHSPDRSEPSLLLCSSGTTGLPKIVRRSRASLSIVAQNMVEAIGITASDRVIAAVPLVHSYGVEHGLLAPLWAGATVYLCDGMNAAHIGRAIERGATVFPAVPSMVEMLAGNVNVGAHSLRLIYSAGSPLPPTVAAMCAERVGVEVGQVYGLTEVGSVTYNDPRRDPPHTIGTPLNGVSLKILNPDDTGEGELAIAAPSMLSEYVGQPLHLVDGHFPTGDLARMTDSGQVQLTGRTKLLIDVGGAKVNPLEVEQRLMEHEGVAQAVVVPLHLSETIRKVRAIVVPTDVRHPPEAAVLRAFLRTRLAAYKIPRVFDVRESLPRSATGKVLRHLLETT